MSKRFVCIWFPYLTTDWLVRKQPELARVPFAYAAPERGRVIVKAINPIAHLKDIRPGMAVADCRAILPELLVFDAKDGEETRLLSAFAEWCLRFTPIAAIDPPGGLILDVSGCSHLWGGDDAYLKDIISKLNRFGYHVRASMADTIGAAWALCRYATGNTILQQGHQYEALLLLPPMALRLEVPIAERLHKLGLHQIKDFVNMPRSVLSRRFGASLLLRLDQALGIEHESITHICPDELLQERLPALEPISTATGIEIALKQLLNTLCDRLLKEGKGLRYCALKCYRIDNNIQEVNISTTRASRNPLHLFKLFEIKISTIRPGSGIELFILEAPVVEEVSAVQDVLWNTTSNNELAVSELIDKLAGKIGIDRIHRYVPAEHHWPELSFKEETRLDIKPERPWITTLPRPIHLLPRPEVIEVTVPLPDYPPMLFRYKGVLHKVKKADGPERIEQEWWLQNGLQRDYYCVEDDAGTRYWIYRAGHYGMGDPEWFIHGFFA